MRIHLYEIKIRPSVSLLGLFHSDPDPGHPQVEVSLESHEQRPYASACAMILLTAPPDCLFIADPPPAYTNVKSQDRQSDTETMGSSYCTVHLMFLAVDAHRVRPPTCGSGQVSMACLVVVALLPVFQIPCAERHTVVKTKLKIEVCEYVMSSIPLKRAGYFVESSESVLCRQRNFPCVNCHGTRTNCTASAPAVPLALLTSTNVSVPAFSM